MSNYVLKYSRDARVRYISHLDFVRMFHRTMRRAGIEPEYSQGFNPHPIMTVAIPLSVGVTADGEYLKVGLKGDMTADEVKDTLNVALPPGYEIKAAKRVEGKELDFAKIDRAEYIAELECGADFDIERMLELSEIIVMKKSKRGERETDIRPMIYEIERMGYAEGVLTARMTLAAGNEATLKPETVIAAIEKYIPEVEITFFALHRCRLMAGETALM